MLEQGFAEVYNKFKVNFFKSVFSNFEDREASLTTVETFCMEMIHFMKNPTVNEFASFTQISPPNAAYKVNSLIQKGYLQKVQSQTDKREYHLQVTEKFYRYYNLSSTYVATVVQRMQERFSPEQLAALDEMLTIISGELMPETEFTRQQSTQKDAL